jgi:DNA invertase Pin-like site-specific DNA recombinase
MILGHTSVSTDGQSVAAQVAQLGAAGPEKVFREMASVANTDGRQLRRVLGQLGAGGVLMVTRLDRLARSARDLLNTLAAIATGGAGFRTPGDASADTTTPRGGLMLTVLGRPAEFGRNLIRARTSEGRERGKARCVELERERKLTAHQRREAVREIARSHNVHRSTVSRLSA